MTCLFGATNLIKAQEPTSTITIGNGNAENYSLPIETYYSYSISQQSYTKTEIADAGGYAGTIHSMAFRTSDEHSTGTRDLRVFLTNIDTDDEVTFDRENDYYQLSNSDVPVFEGEVNFIGNGWTTIEFQNPFAYNGNHLLVTVIDDTGETQNDIYFAADSKDGNSKGGNRINWATNTGLSSPADPTSDIDASPNSSRNQIQLTIEELPKCPIYITLTDKWIDGWNGNVLEIEYAKGTKTYSLDNGRTATYTLDVTTLSDIKVTYVKQAGNSKPEENGFTITYEYGKVVCDYLQGSFADAEDGERIDCGEYNIDCTLDTPVAPTATAEAKSETEIALKISGIGAESYNIYNSTEMIAEGVTENPYTVEGLTAGTEYCFTVTSVNEAGESEPSEETCATTFGEGSSIVTIGNGNNVNSELPIDDTFASNYSLSQQIYTAEEIGLDIAKIRSISFHQAAGYNNVRDIVVYMKNVNKSSFDSNYDWIEVSESDIVYEGLFNFGMPEEWVNITFQNAFEYEGGNIAVTVYDRTGVNYGIHEEYYDRFYISETDGTRGLKYSDYSFFDLSQYLSYAGSMRNSTNNIKLRADAPVPGMRITPSTFDLGDIRKGEYWSTKEKPSIDVAIRPICISITDISSDNDFFVLPEVIDYTKKTIEFTINYDEYADAGEYNGNLIITYEEGDTIIPMTANVYEPIAGDVIENPIAITFDEGNYGTFSYAINSLEGFYEDYTIGDALPDLVFELTVGEDEPSPLISINKDNCSVCLLSGYTTNNGPSYQLCDISNAVISAGTHYVVVVPNSLPAEFSITKDIFAPSNVRTEDGNYEIVENTAFTLTWDGANTDVWYNIYEQLENGGYKFIYRTNQCRHDLYAEPGAHPCYYAVSMTLESPIESPIESPKVLSNEMIKVIGYGSVSGYVKNHETPIPGLTFELSRTNAAGHELTNTITTDENGHFESQILEGSYTLTISDGDYFEKVIEDIVIEYGKQTDLGTIDLTIKPNVTVVDKDEYAKITWTGENDAYNVYRKYLNSSEYERIALRLVNKEYDDYDWSSLAIGEYLYGVCRTEERQEDILYESFDNGFSETWSKSGTVFITDAQPYSYNNKTCALQGFGNYPSTLTTPSIDLTGCDDATVRFYVKNIDGSTLTIKAKATEDNTWNTINTYESMSSFNQVNIPLTDYCGKAIQLQFEVSGGGYTCIDELGVSCYLLLEYEIYWSDAVIKYAVFTGAADNDWHNDANWNIGEEPNADVNVKVNADAVISSDVNINSLVIADDASLTVDNSGVLAVAGVIENDNGSLIINDGGQIFQSNENVYATFNMNIENPENWTEDNTTGWQFIGSPFVDASIASFNPSEGDFDLYKYNGQNDLEWTNYKVGYQEVDSLVQIGEGNIFVDYPLRQTPICDAQLHSISQTIYTANEIGFGEAEISSISYNLRTANENTRNVSIYLENITSNNFVAKDAYNNTILSWKTPSPESCVFSGNITYGSTAGWMTIELQNRFSYTGGNLLVTVIDNTGKNGGNNMFYSYKTSDYINQTYYRTIYSTSGKKIEPSNITLTANPSSDRINGVASCLSPQIKFNFVTLVPYEEFFTSGDGYLASYETEETATLSGNLYSEDNFTFEMQYSDDKDMANFNLLGNPFPFNMKWSNVELNNVYPAFATINPTTGGYVISHDEGTIPVGDGFFVEAIGASPSLSYGTSSKSRGKDMTDYINVVATGKQGSNNLIVKFSGEEEAGFSKLKNINQSIADVYVVKNEKQYSILGYDKNTTEIELFFDAKEMGNYSISLDINGWFENVFLVDRLTDIETDMLHEDEYSFTSTSNENPNRFVLRLNEGQQTTDDSHFAYISNNDIIIYDIAGNAYIKIFDAMGRCVYQGDSSDETTRIANGYSAGVYMIQKVDDKGIKVQKIIL